VHRVAVGLIRTPNSQRPNPKRPQPRVQRPVSYQVLARKWRPQRFDDVVGQQAVTRTLRNAIASGRIAHAFVFAGPRGCGKTTTARILARALNCVQGPTPDPCGECDACVEIAQGRDMDVLEIDAASHTGIDNVREVIIAGLSIAPVRDRYKVFIIDEVHQLSMQSFNALLKSIEEPPAHVVFMMATTELHKIPDTILSRSQVFEFRQIATKAIAEQLRRIADAEKIEVPDAALALIARDASGSMRDAQSALDQVLAFSGNTITLDDVSTVLGLVGRDLLFDLVEAVVEEDAPKAFATADRAVESGHDLRIVLRELAQLTRDIMIVSVDPPRLNDAEITEAERERLQRLAARFSREDLMRAFELLSTAEVEIRTVAQPRYYFEMVLLRWMHLRKLVPLTELLEQIGGSGAARQAPPSASRPSAPTRNEPASVPPRRAMAGEGATPPAERSETVARSQPSVRAQAAASTPPMTAPTNVPALKHALLSEIRSRKQLLYEVAIAMAQHIEVQPDQITFTFAANQNVARMQLEQNRDWIERAVETVAGRRIPVRVLQADSPSSSASTPAPTAPLAEPVAKRDLKAEALASSAVQAMLDVFPAEIRDVEEM
jgi:DNA polymerase-3 subunit gamma/tau